MAHLKFDLAKLERLNDPGRFETLIPDVMWRALAVDDPDVIVEIGAGTGVFSARFAQMAPRATIYAADIAPQMVEWMTANRSEVAAGVVVPVLADETAVPLPDEVADAVITINLHHELAEPVATYAEAARLLRPGGRILVADWAARETPKGPPMAVRATEEQLRSALEAAGFDDIRADDRLPHHSLLTGTRAP